MEKGVVTMSYAKTNDGFDGEAVHFSNGHQASAEEAATIDELPSKKKLEEEREGWGNKVEFVLAVIGYAVGLGNVWRFPYLAQKNGGGAFLIPYTIALFSMGIPIFFLELAIGQRLRRGPLHVWNMISPKFTGLGISSVIVSFLVGVYYNMIVAWCFYYLFISFQGTPPYAKCPTEGPNNTFVEECAKAGSTQYYWYRVALEATENIETSGGLNWKLSLCLLLSWALLFGITCRGVKSMGKVVYFTALFPYVVLIIFFIRGLTLTGSGAGIKHMFTPDFAKLQRAEVWLEASTQIFYSFGLAFGGLISMASYNPINNNAARDALLVSFVNVATSIFAGIVVFSILGYKATMRFQECERQWVTGMTKCDMQYFLDQVAEGPGLTFIAFTEAIATMDAKWLWSILFFTMLLTLGIGSMIGTFECVRMTVIELNIIPLRGEFVGAILTLASFLFGLLFCQRSGEYWLQMFDSFSGTIGLLAIGFFEVVIVVYFYGLKRFENDIFYMLGSRPNWYWKITWMVLCPLFTVALIISSIYELFAKDIKYKAWDSKEVKVVSLAYPDWGEALCFILILASFIFIPIIAILTYFDLFKLESPSVATRELEVQIEQGMHPAAMTKSISSAPLSEFEEPPAWK